MVWLEWRFVARFTQLGHANGKGIWTRVYHPDGPGWSIDKRLIFFSRDLHSEGTLTHREGSSLT
jgi:hypothetical protein